MNLLKNNDLTSALERRELWLYLAWQDIRLRYRRSKIGPFWITLSMTIFILSLGVVYSQLFKMEVAEYLPFLAVSFVLWGLISTTLGDAPNIFVDAASYLKDIRINPMVIILRIITRNTIIFLHNLIILVGIYLYFGINPGLNLMIGLVGMLLVLLNLIALTIPLSFLGARYRDVGPIVQSLVQVIFFVTPITWMPKLVSSHSLILKINPFSYYLDLVRTPLLGASPELDSWVVSILTLVFFTALSCWIYSAKSRRIAFWI
jgi:ABC-type polysaccharide/polyol phosphate export permease